MTKEEILNGNKLIAEFMGLGFQFHLCEHPKTGEYVEPKFNTSWDWIMPVIKKIKLEYNVRIETLADESIQYCEIISNIHDDLLQIAWIESRIDTAQLIEVVYSAIIEFIKWYNEKCSE